MAYDALPGLVANGSPARHYKRFKFWILAGVILVSFVLFGLARRQLVQPKLAQIQPQLFTPTPPPAPPRLYLRTGDLGPEGLGVRLLL